MNESGLLGNEVLDHRGVDVLTEIRDMLSERSAMSEEDMERFSDMVAEKTFTLHKEEKRREAEEKKDKESLSDTWIEGDQFFQCRPCGVFSQSAKVPGHYHGLRRGNFGEIGKYSEDGTKRKNVNIVRGLRKHESNDLHVWCALHERDEENNKIDLEKKNKLAGQIVIRNVVKALKHGQSSIDFQSDNNLFHILADSQSIVFATKNDSADAFFKIRDVVYEVVTEKTRKWFSEDGNGNIEDISITLDKVTVQRTSYTALLTYFFWKGQIHVILNRLMKMGEDEYDSVGTARAVVAALMETLGMTRTRLANTVRHFAYDGVYATFEQRVDGGGSLNLVNYIAEELDLDVGDITGTWDVSHQMQIIWHRTLKQRPEILDLIKIYFDAMKEWNLGKSSTIFANRARDLGNLVLTNKTYQTTRFVRSLLRGLRAAMQNLPTIIAILATDYEEATLECRNTDAGTIWKKLEKLRNPVNLVKTLGVLELLEIYAETSLEAQYSKHFPSQVWSSIIKAQAKLEQLASCWKWSVNDLNYSVVEAPSNVINRLIEKAEYKPKILQKNLRNKAKEMRDAGLLDVNQNVHDLFRDVEEVVPIAGEAVMSPITMEDVKRVEVQLQEYAGTILKEWKKRHVQTELEVAASNLLGEEVFEEFRMRMEDNEDPVDVQEHEVDGRANRELLDMLQKLISKLPGYQAERFIAVEILPGLVSWLTFYKQLTDADEKLTQEVVYAVWYEKHVMVEGSPACNALFAGLFENLQIRSSSEVCIYSTP
jgi:hypothetical protein